MTTFLSKSHGPSYELAYSSGIELRNKIYEYHYDTIWTIELIPKTATNYRINEAHPVPSIHPLTPGSKEDGSQNLIIRFGKPLGRYSIIDDKKTRWQYSMSGLHLINKQTHHECLKFMYGSIKVFAQSSMRLTNFLTMVPKHNLEFVKRLQLDYQTAGPAHLRGFEKMKIVNERKWANACKLAVRVLVNVEELVLNIDVRDVPRRFVLDEPWVKSTYCFRKLKLLNDLHVHVFSPELRLTEVDTKSEATWSGYTPAYVRFLVVQHEAAKEMHQLFGRAVAMKIQNYCDKCALKEYRAACHGKYKIWIPPSNLPEREGHTQGITIGHERGACRLLKEPNALA